MSGAILVCLGLGNHPDIDPSPLHLRIKRQTTTHGLIRVLVTALKVIGIAKIVLDVGRFRIDSRRQFKLLHGALEIAAFRVQAAQRVVRINATAIERDRLDIRQLRLVQPLLPVIEARELVIRLGIGRTVADGRIGLDLVRAKTRFIGCGATGAKRRYQCNNEQTQFHNASFKRTSAHWRIKSVRFPLWYP